MALKEMIASNLKVLKHFRKATHLKSKHLLNQKIILEIQKCTLIFKFQHFEYYEVYNLRYGILKF